MRAASWHRRGLAAVAAALAVLTGVSAALPPAPATVDVVVAARQLRGGSVLGADDVEIRPVTTGQTPQGATTDSDLLLGRTLAAPVAEGQVLTALAVVSPRTGVGDGQLVAPVRLADAGVVALLRAGDVVDLIGADEQNGTASVVARSVRVVTVPDAGGADEADVTGGLLLVAVSATTATDLARAAAVGPLTLTWR